MQASAERGEEVEVPRFLVVDDEQVNALLLQQILAARGFEVAVAEGGEAALEYFRENPVDMVLMDIMMPGVDGYEATRRIKELDTEGFTPVLFVTALHDEHQLARCVEVGGDDFVTKPISRVQLNAKIDAWLRTRNLYRTVTEQRDALQYHQDRLQAEQETAERIIERASVSSALDSPGVRRVYQPAETLSGDIILATWRPNGNFVALFGDFTGHGIGAAVGVPPLADRFHRGAARGAPPAQLLDQVNERLYQALPPEMFLTAILVEVDPVAGTIGVWNGGMPAPVLVAAGEVVARPASTGLPLGVVRDETPGRRRLDYRGWPAGARLYLASDGVVEAVDAAGELFGEARLEEALTAAPPEEAFDGLLAAVSDHRRTEGQRDDLTLLELDLDTLAAHAPAGHGSATEGWSVELTLEARQLLDYNPLFSAMNLFNELGAVEAENQDLYIILSELLSNAVDHGLLGLDSALKRSPEGFAEYYQRREAALAALEGGKIRLMLGYEPEAEGTAITIEIADHGPGFDYAATLAQAAEGDPEGCSGRGIALVRSLCEELEYRPPGNRVRARYRAHRRVPDPA
jgi:CheY-like chemotaxis protein/anti-sigma regulatory factor (Ser/Thr protein kinase)